jgi:hypothetical protein
MTARKKPNLRDLFFTLQGSLTADLETGRKALTHPGALGLATEEGWRKMLGKLPGRYCISKAFVIDSNGTMSHEIDLVVHDRQYSPLLFEHHGALYVPAESVYAVFEIKQVLNARNLRYAIEKAASVRRLERTSAPFRHAEGTSVKQPSEILAGLLCLKSGRAAPLERSLRPALEAAPPEGRLDLVCSLRNATADITYDANGRATFQTSADDTALIFFFLRLLARLREMATVPAMDLEKYGRVLEPR